MSNPSNLFMEVRMANKLYAMEQLTEEVAKDVAANPQEWMRFLDTASRLYRYTFPEQLLIYAQRPEATAVASMEICNQKMYRWIKKGSKGIALIDNTSGPKTKLRYVFDVGDTYKVSRCLFYFQKLTYISRLLKKFILHNQYLLYFEYLSFHILCTDRCKTGHPISDFCKNYFFTVASIM